MTDEVEDEEMPAAPKMPRREADARMALIAIAMVFFIGIAIGFVLAKTL